MSPRQLHVLFVARWYPSHDQPGRGTFVADLAAALEATGQARVTVASFEPTHVRGLGETRTARAGEANSALADAVARPSALVAPVSWGVPGIPVARLPAILDGDRRRPTEMADAHAIPLLAFARGLHARAPIDVIHAHTGLPDGVAAQHVADELDLPLVITEHASTTADQLIDDEARALYRHLVTPPRRVVAVSRALAHDVARALGVADSVIAVLPNAVPVDAFPLGDAGRRRTDELLYVGSRKASKGIETLLRAFAEMRLRRPAVRLRLIGPAGPPDDEARWEALIEALGIGEAVFVEPPAPRVAVAEAMRRATIFVHPSPHETFGMVAAEALAAGLPVAATPSGGVDEIVGRDGRFGAIATSTAVTALVDAIDRALAAAPRADPIAMRAHVESRYAAPEVARRALELYAAVATQARTLPRAGTQPAAARRTEARQPGLFGEPGKSAEPGHRGRSGRSGSAVPTGETGTRTGAAAAPFRLPLVLALARGQAVERAGLLPPALRDRLTVVTSPRGKYADDRDLPEWGHWLELDQDRVTRDAMAELTRSRPSGGFGRLKAALGGGAARARAGEPAQPAELRAAAIQQYLVRAMAQVAARDPGANDDRRWIVALDADDIVLAARVAPAVGELAPGGLRWLADTWDSAGRPG